MFENLNISGSIWKDIKEWIKEKHPEFFKKYEKVYFSKNNYCNKVEEEIRQFCNNQNIEFKIYFHHNKK